MRIKRRFSGISPHAIQQMLSLVRLRTEPAVRLREISAALASSETDPDYAQDLEDLTWYLNGKLDSVPIREDTSDFQFNVQRPQNNYTPLTPAQKQPGFEKTYADVADLRSISSLIDWLITIQSPSGAGKKHALSEWKRVRTELWLVAALAKSSASDPEAAALIEAAGIPSTSPAYPTVSYHRIRLLLESGRAPQARCRCRRGIPGHSFPRKGLCAEPLHRPPQSGSRRHACGR